MSENKNEKKAEKHNKNILHSSLERKSRIKVGFVYIFYLISLFIYTSKYIWEQLRALSVLEL